MTFAGRLTVYRSDAPGRVKDRLHRITDRAVILAVLPTELTYTNTTTIECALGPAAPAS